MAERLNSADREQCGCGCDGTSDVSSVSRHDTGVPDVRRDVPTADILSTGQPGCILRSLLSRPAHETTASDVRTVTHQHGGHSQTFQDGVGHRPRSRSMGTRWWTIPEVASSTSQESLDYVDDRRPFGSAGESRMLGESLHTDRLIEVARCKLMTLQTSEEYNSSYRSRLSSSQPGSPPRTDMLTSDKHFQQRKYSEGSRLKACLQGLRSGFRTPDCSDLHPVDFSCRRRKKFEGISGLPYSRPAAGYPASNTSTDEGLGDDCSSEQSILKSILTGRGRSNTISACGSTTRYDALGKRADQPQRIARQPVALAKKNLHPVMAKINDCVNQVITSLVSK